MDETTIRALNEINRRFYARHADSFDASRGSAWTGWKRVIPHLRPNIRVLDVGCGNGRFGVFLAEAFGADRLHYHGIDSSPALLDHAREALSALPQKTLEARDLLIDPLPEGQFDCVALFGVLHHIPGAERRLAFLRDLAAKTSPGGILAFTAWRFYEYPRFREQIVAWDAAMQVEAGDYLLDWQRDSSTPRYCHYVDDAEHARLIETAGLTVVDDFRADGFDGQLNRYTILRRDMSGK